MTYIETSAKENIKVAELFDIVIKEIMKKKLNAEQGAYYNTNNTNNKGCCTVS